LVAKDYYQQELNYQEDIDAINRTVDEGLTPKLETESGKLWVTLPQGVQPQQGDIHLYRPDDPSADQHYKLLNPETGITTKGLKKGRWEVRVRFQYQNKWYQHQQTWVN
jgi:hypothetical protein